MPAVLLTPSTNDSLLEVEVWQEEDRNLAVTIILELVICITFILGTVLNTFLVILFCRRRGFRTLSNRFVLNLAVANLLSSLLLTPLSLLDQTSTALYSSPVFCSLLTTAVTLVSTASLLATLLIGLDQYLAIVAPLHYHSRITKRRVLLLCSVAWLLAIVTALAAVLDPGSTLSYFTWSHACHPTPHLYPYSAYRLAVCLTLVGLVYILPFLLITLTYIRIFTAAHGNSVRTRRNSACSTRRNSVCSMYGRQTSLAPPAATLNRSPSIRSTGNQILSNISTLRISMKSRLSHASALLLYREETRAARVTVLVVLVVAVCWGPYLTLLLLHTGHMYSPPPPPWLHPLALALLNTYTVISPLLYAYRSRGVQRDVRRLLGVDRGRSKQEKMFRKMKSFSCPQLVLTSCHSLPGPGASTAQLQACRSYIDMRGRTFLPSFSVSSPSEQDPWADSSHDSSGPSEMTPCISVTGPEEGPVRVETRASLDSGYQTPLSPTLGHHLSLSPHHLDVSL